MSQCELRHPKIILYFVRLKNYVILKVEVVATKCVFIKGKRKFEIKEVAEPILEKGEVIIDVKKCGICGSDIYY